MESLYSPSKPGGFVVSSPLDPGMWTQAESVDEAFVNARDALKELAAARRERKPRRISSGRVA
jgi:predicted RNase H-like HicB family nuclease